MADVGSAASEVRRIDFGRVVAVSAFMCLFLLNGLKLFSTGEPGQDRSAILTGLLTMIFYLLLVIAYLRRSPSSRTDMRWTSWLVAFAGTCAPFALPLTSSGARDEGAIASLAVIVLVAGLAAMLWALGALGTNISVVPQAREVITHGPYAHVRHPLYTAELINVFGICLAMSGAGPWIVLVALVALQVLRARREEALLSRELPGYTDYQTRTPMLVPFFGRT
jgi:protein-S-isoprenylcysteine O-methyltransferase Ste14